MSTNSLYTEEYYKALNEGSRQSAREIVPLVLELTQPKSVVDVGCGLGTWLSVFKEFGIKDCLGIDGDYIDKNTLEIEQDQFTPFDLRNPLQLDREFDLVVSLEVAEHLPIECAETFVESLTRLGPVVLFSAALPFQGGTDHINEQWLDYWSNYFLKRGYLPIDCLRKKLWQNNYVEIWYKQNIMLFVKKNCLENYPLLKIDYGNTYLQQLSIVHPKLYSKKILELQNGIEALQEWGVELEKQLVELQKQMIELKELKPGSIALRNILRALPTLTKHALTTKIKRYFSKYNEG